MNSFHAKQRSSWAYSRRCLQLSQTNAGGWTSFSCSMDSIAYEWEVEDCKIETSSQIGKKTGSLRSAELDNNAVIKSSKPEHTINCNHFHYLIWRRSLSLFHAFMIIVNILFTHCCHLSCVCRCYLIGNLICCVWKSHLAWGGLHNYLFMSHRRQ